MPISIGRSCPLVFWLDGRELARAEFETFRTPENLNLDIVELPAGKHRAVFKVVRQGPERPSASTTNAASAPESAWMLTWSGWSFWPDRKDEREFNAGRTIS